MFYSHPTDKCEESKSVSLKQFADRDGRRVALTIFWDWWSIVGLVMLGQTVHLWWIYPLVVFVLSRRMYCLFELTHHAAHRNLFSKPSFNDRLDFLFAAPIFESIVAFREEHLDHHGEWYEPSEPRDAEQKFDGNYLGAYGFDPRNAANRAYVIWFLFLRPLTGILQFVELRSVAKRFRKPKYSVPILVFWVPTLTGVYLLGGSRLLFWYWFVPRFTVYPVLYFWSDVVFHFNCQNDQIRDTAALGSLLFNIRGSGRHNLHHRYPDIPYFNINKASAALVDPHTVSTFRGRGQDWQQLISIRTGSS